jgi:excisionase family DNA binding protein
MGDFRGQDRAEKTYRIPGLAVRLNCSPYTARAWLRQGRLEYFRLGRIIVVTESAVVRFMEAGRVPAREDAARSVVRAPPVYMWAAA